MTLNRERMKHRNHAKVTKALPLKVKETRAWCHCLWALQRKKQYPLHAFCLQVRKSFLHLLKLFEQFPKKSCCFFFKLMREVQPVPHHLQTGFIFNAIIIKCVHGVQIFDCEPLYSYSFDTCMPVMFGSVYSCVSPLFPWGKEVSGTRIPENPNQSYFNSVL